MDSAVFKGLTGGDRITGELKYRDSFEFTPFCRLLFSANHLPASRDGSQAYFDRWLIVPFEVRFRGTGTEIPRQVLDARLATSVELSGALNRAMPALRRIRSEGRFSETGATRAQIADFRQAMDPCELWLKAQTISSPVALISQERFYSAYILSCIGSNQPIMTRQMFGRKLKRLRPDLQEGQRVLDGKKQWVYLGIALRGAADGIERPIHSM
jgi:putative DNA primase/helicase